MDSDWTFENHGGDEEERVRSFIDQAIGRAAFLASQNRDGFDALMDLGDELFKAIDDTVGITTGPNARDHL